MPDNICELCGAPPAERQEPVRESRCMACGGRHRVCGACRIAWQVEEPGLRGWLRYCPDAARVARELMGEDA